MSEETLITSCLNGNRLAQFQLYKAYSKPMFNLCIRLLGDIQDAEDALQIAFTHVFLKLKLYRFEATLGAWIKKIVLHTCFNELKKKKIHWVSIDNIEMEESEEDYEEETLDFKIVENSLLSLPDGYRIVLSLYLFEGYDHSEIAQILGISESTSKSQYSRARLRLKEIIKQSHERF